MDERAPKSQQHNSDNAEDSGLLGKVIVKLPADDEPAIAATDDSGAAAQESNPAKRTLKEIVVEQGFMIALTAVIAVATSMYTYYARKQWKTMDEQLAAMREQIAEMKSGSADTHELAVQAKNQANRTKDVADRALTQANATNDLARQAKRSADAAVISSRTSQEAVSTGRRNLDLAKQSFFVQERPWIGVDSFSGIVEDGKPISGTITFRNFGHTPAFDVTIVTACSYDKVPQSIFEGSYVFVPSGSKSVMMPDGIKGTDGLSCDLHLSPVQFDRVEHGLNKVFLFGHVSYKDSINAANPNHSTRFCGVWNPKTRKFDDCKPAYDTAD